MRNQLSPLLKPAQFDALVALTNIRPGARRDAARYVLSEGLGFTDAAALAGSNRQHCYGAVKILRKALDLAKKATA